MKKILIVETGKLSPNSTIAHIRNAITLQRELSQFHQCSLVDLTTDIDITKQWDIILFSYAGLGCDFDSMEKLVENQTNCKIGWITNEFELFANGFVKKHITFMITNFEEHGIKKAHRHDQLLVTNLNTLIFTGTNDPCEKKYDVCYYGTYRKYREIYFLQYLKGRMIFSTSKKNWKRFIDVGMTGLVTDKLSWEPNRETLNLFKASLYIEDTKTHNCYNHMGNRFYEALQCNTAMFYDKTCQNTIDKSPYMIDGYFVVESYDELMDKVDNLDTKLVSEFIVDTSEFVASERDDTIYNIITFLDDL